MREPLYGGVLAEGGGVFRYVEVKPTGLPTLQTWLAACNGRARADVVQLRRCVMRERDEAGLRFDGERWIVNVEQAVRQWLGMATQERPCLLVPHGIVSRVLEWRRALGLTGPCPVGAGGSVEDGALAEALQASVVVPGEQATPVRRLEHAVAVALSEFAGQLGRACVQAWSDRLASQWWLLVGGSRLLAPRILLE